mmetsp:Transcript_3481/g.7260  ORF Transcript_3481/g.7260 Transcript_3481/m.7260 type:complete len:225 (+) Transcript_3481:18-692(+)
MGELFAMLTSDVDYGRYYWSMPVTFPHKSSSNEDVSVSASGSSRNTVIDSQFPSQLLPLVPEQSPIVWQVINNTLALSGCLLIVDCLYANKYDSTNNLEEKPFAQAYFLIWEFATCFFWTLETGLSIAYQYYALHEHHLPWYSKAELAIAAYFMATTFAMLCQWDLMKYEPSSVWEISLDTSFYVYMSIRSCQRTVEPEPPMEPAAISLMTLRSGNGVEDHLLV